MTVQLSGIYRYPLKSLAGVSLESSQVENYGLKNDRCMMLVDENGLFISQRKYPELALIEVKSEQSKITLGQANSPTIAVDTSTFGDKQVRVEVWGDSCNAFIASEEVNFWFSKLLNQKVFLVKYDVDNPRPTDPKYSKHSDIVSFADGFPILLISQSSLDDLNNKLETPVSMLNFRPNMVVDGCEAFNEDDWKTIKVGNVKFDLVKSCSRCILTTVDPKMGIKNDKGQPLKTLAKYRKTKMGVVFGMNLIPRSNGKIQLGDVLEIIR